MTITVECPACHARFRVEDQYAGKRGRCRNCQEVIQVPAATADDLAEVGLVPVEDPPPASRAVQRSSASKPRSAVVEIISTPPPPPQMVEEDDSAGYMLADGAGKKAKAVRARADRLPGVGVMPGASATRPRPRSGP